MEPITNYFESIDRVGIGIQKKEPFKQWLKSVYDDTTEQDFAGTVYMVTEEKLGKGMESWLKTTFEEIFENELNEWTTDETKWPDNRSYEIFREWFEPIYFEVLYDLEK